MTRRKWIALALAGMGSVFLLQGLGLTASLYPSFMNNDLRWSLVGIVELIAAVFLWQRQPAAK